MIFDKSIKKIRALGLAAALFSACGDETQLHYYDAPPLPRAVTPHETGLPELSPSITPSMNFNLTFQHCLGPLASEQGNFDSICPIDLETGSCDNNFRRILQETKDSLETLLRDQISVNPFDLLDGEISIPTTIFALYYSSENTHIFSRYNEEKIVSENLSTMHVTFGDNVAALQEYESGGYFSDSNFPLDNILCKFRRIEDPHDESQQYFSLRLVYQKAGEKIVDIALAYDNSLGFFGPTKDSHVVISIPAETHFYTSTEFNLSVTAYAIKDLQESGEERTEELLEIGSSDEDHFEHGVFYWE